jgi:hypothetical protein
MALGPFHPVQNKKNSRVADSDTMEWIRIIFGAGSGSVFELKIRIRIRIEVKMQKL